MLRISGRRSCKVYHSPHRSPNDTISLPLFLRSIEACVYNALMLSMNQLICISSADAIFSIVSL